MANRTRVIVVLAMLVLCALATLCAFVGYVVYHATRGTPSMAEGGRGPERTAVAGTRSGATLRLMGGLPPTLDPAMVQDSTSAEYVVHLYSGLVTLNSKLEITPDLADRWEVSPDGLRYVFHLLPNATFQNGRPISAEDVRYSIERACDPKLRSPVAESYLGDLVGAADYMSGKAERIAGIKVLDEHTLQLDIDAPKAYFLAKLTYSTAFVVDRTQIEEQGAGWLRQPNGSGPFVLESMTRERLVLVRNERYYGDRPALARVEYATAQGQPITMYENNQLDMVELGPGDIERITDPENPLHAELRTAPELSVQYLALNVNQPPFDDPAVRQAFAHAIDKAKIADLVLKGMATPAKGILPPSLPDYDAAFAGLPYDPARARQLLAASRYGKPGAMPAIVLAVSGTSGSLSSETRAILSMVKENLGIDVTVHQVAWADFLRDMNEHAYQCYSSGWIGDYPDSQNFCDLLFHSSSPQNHTGYKNSEVDALLERARVATSGSDRTRLYRQAERLIVADAPWVPLTHGVAYTLVKPNVAGFRASAAIYPWLKEVRLSD